MILIQYPANDKFFHEIILILYFWLKINALFTLFFHLLLNIFEIIYKYFFCIYEFEEELTISFFNFSIFFLFLEPFCNQFADQFLFLYPQGSGKWRSSLQNPLLSNVSEWLQSQDPFESNFYKFDDFLE